MRRLKYRFADIAGTCTAKFKHYRFADCSRLLMFHGVGDDVDADHDLYCHSPKQFVDQISAISHWAAANGVSYGSFTPDSRGHICLTFDDGYASLHTFVAPYLLENGIPFHIFIPVKCLTEEPSLHLSLNQLCELAKEPLIGIGAHGYSHQSLLHLSARHLHDELMSSRSELQSVSGRTITTMSYPFGEHDQRVNEAARTAGFTLAATSKSGLFDRTTDFLQVPRTDIWAMDSPRTVVSKLQGGWDWIL